MSTQTSFFTKRSESKDLLDSLISISLPKAEQDHHKSESKPKGPSSSRTT